MRCRASARNFTRNFIVQDFFFTLESPIFRNTWECYSIFDQHVMKYLNFRSSGSKLESVTWKFTKNRNSSQVFFKEFCYKCRTEILKNAFWWLLLVTTLFWKFSWMAASQRQLQRCIYLRNSKLQIFYISYCDVIQNFIYRTPGYSELFFRNRRCRKRFKL